MLEKDLILDASHQLEFEEIADYMNGPAKEWWQAINTFIHEKYQISPKITYSKCSMQTGWNVKYQKSGKSLCTLYPEKDSFIVLIVIKLELADMIEVMSANYDPVVLEIVRSARPFNGTKWLMIPVGSDSVLKNVQALMALKQEIKPKEPAKKKE